MLRLFFLLLLLSPLVFAKTYVREYTYNASENDSKVSARKAAMRQIQVLVIEEVGVQIRSRYSKEERLEDEQYSKAINAKYESFAQAITKTKILDEKWDGEKFYLKAEVDIDPDNMGKVFETIVPRKAGGENGAGEAMSQCEIDAGTAKKMLGNLSSQKHIDAIVDFAMAHPFDNECNTWQLDIIDTFKKYKTSTPKYRQFLVESLKTFKYIGPDDKRGDKILRYLAAIQKFEITDIEVLTQLLGKSDSSLIEDYFRTVLNNAKPDAFEAFTERILDTADAKKLGLPVSLDRTQAVKMIVNAVKYADSDAFETLYRKNFNTYLGALDDQWVLKILLDRYFAKHSTKKRDNLIIYIQDVKPSCDVAKNYYLLLKKLKNTAGGNYPKGIYPNVKEKSIYFDDVALIMKETAKKRKELVKLCKNYDHDKLMNGYLLVNNITTGDTPSPKESAKRMFTEQDKSEAKRYANFLLYGGESAIKEAKTEIIDGIKSSQTLDNINNELVKILFLLKSNDPVIIDYLVDLTVNFKTGGQMQRDVETILTSGGIKSLEQILRHYPQKRVHVSERVINLATLFPVDKKELIARLEKLPRVNGEHERLIKKTILKLSR